MKKTIQNSVVLYEPCSCSESVEYIGSRAECIRIAKRLSSDSSIMSRYDVLVREVVTSVSVSDTIFNPITD